MNKNNRKHILGSLIEVGIFFNQPIMFNKSSHLFLKLLIIIIMEVLSSVTY